MIPPPADIYGPDAPTSPDSWVFHYTRIRTLAALAPQGAKFQLSRLASTNDPREYKDRNIITRTESSGFESPPKVSRADFERVQGRVNAARLNIRVGCFVRDGADGTVGSAARADSRGFARQAIWSHYGDRHAGVSFVIDPLKLAEVLVREFGEEGVHVGPVDYQAGFDVDAGLIVGFDASGRSELDGLDARALERRLAPSLFVKNADWSYEREWRCAVTGQPAHRDVEFDLQDVIVGVIVGPDFPRSQIHTLQAFGQHYGLGRGSVLQVDYDDQSGVMRPWPLATDGLSYRFFAPAERATTVDPWTW